LKKKKAGDMPKDEVAEKQKNLDEDEDSRFVILRKSQL
jgi:hypothetical protein